MRGLVLEIASGTGQHVTHFARELPHLDWQPSEPNPEMHASIIAWIAQTVSTTYVLHLPWMSGRKRGPVLKPWFA